MTETIKLPTYTEREERINVITHFIGFIMGVVSLIAMLVVAISNTIFDSKNYIDIISAILFGGSLTMLYGMSTIYHNEKDMVKRRKRQKFDHLSINILIAGSSSAYLISGLRNTIGFCVIGGIWFLSIISMILNSINVKKFRAVTMVIYLLTGWSPIFLSKMIIDTCSIGCFSMLLAGGLSYTIGLTFYAIKREFMHSIWHCFVLVGSLLHILGIFIYVF